MPPTTSRSYTIIRIAVCCMLGLGVLAILNLLVLEFGPLRGDAIAVDETYFSACAIRGLAVGEIPITGCHDTKTPLIYLIHQLVQLHAQPYDVEAVKVAAVCTFVLIVILVAVVGYRIDGALASLSGAALALQAFSSDVHFLALKTETVGSVFMLLGVAVILGDHRAPSRWRWLTCGLLFGLAISTKQTFAFAAIGLTAYLAMADVGQTGAARSFALAKIWALFVAGLALPSLAFLFVFSWQGRELDYLASVLLYPTVYIPRDEAVVAKRLIWRAGGVFEDLGRVPLIAALSSAVFVVGLNWRRAQSALQSATQDNGLRLVALLILSMMLAAFIAPIYFSYYLLPILILMSIGGGAIVARAASSLDSAYPPVAGSLCAVLVTFSALVAATSWNTNGGLGRQLTTARDAVLLERRAGRYAFVLGYWPQFYVYNQLVPASSVQVPSVLPGAPANWAYTPPAPDSPLGRLLSKQQSRNLRRLFEDFRQTPPDYVVISHDFARLRTSDRVTDVPGFDEYLDDHCHYAGSLPLNLGSAQSLYRCNTRVDR